LAKFVKPEIIRTYWVWRYADYVEQALRNSNRCGNDYLVEAKVVIAGG
jgi:hypothetical protein